jgi:pectate lyase
LPPHLLSDRESASFMEVFEDGRPLGPGHAPHEDVRRLGQGRFSHWGDRLYFSTSDNSDPRTNGRHYTVKEVRR